MLGRRQQAPRRLGLRRLAGALSVGLAVTAGAAIMATAGPANAAPTPNPSYHPGADPATFTVLGVVDGNCTISTGGTEVWIKPGDKINFNSSVAGINLSLVDGLVTGLLGLVAGLNVDAIIDGKTAHPQAFSFSVAGGKTTAVPTAGHPALSAGDHTLRWSAKSIALVPGLLGPRTPLPLSSNDLKSGASLSWSGVIHVTNDTAQCKISVGTPGVSISVGPVKVIVPPINVGVPEPNLPNLPGVGGGQAPGGGNQNTSGRGGVHYTPPPLTVPEQAMGRGGAGGGVLPDGGAASRIGVNVPQVPVANGGDPALTDAAGKARVITRSLGLAANRAPGGQLPVLLAIIAIIALSLVTATYARLYLLRRDI